MVCFTLEIICTESERSEFNACCFCSSEKLKLQLFVPAAQISLARLALFVEDGCLAYKSRPVTSLTSSTTCGIAGPWPAYLLSKKMAGQGAQVLQKILTSAPN